MKKNPRIERDGVKRWYNKKGQVHRTDGPAYINKNGSRRWYQNDKLHRTDGPAEIGEDGEEYWYINGKPVEPIPDLICYLRKKLKQ